MARSLFDYTPPPGEQDRYTLIFILAPKQHPHFHTSIMFFLMVGMWMSGPYAPRKTLPLYVDRVSGDGNHSWWLFTCTEKKWGF